MGWCVLDDLCRSSVISCSETKKPPWKVVFKDSSELELFRIKVTGSSREQSPKVPFQFSQQWHFCTRLSREFPVTQGFHLGALACPNGLDFKRLLPFERESRAERGDSANSPTRSGAPQHDYTCRQV